MLFNSLSFAIFFPVVAIVHFLIPQKARVPFLLAASCIFYMAFVPKYILILFSLITLDFFLAQFIEKHSGRQRLALLWISICANLGMLFFFKYWNFFTVNVAALAAFLHWNYSPMLLTVVLPLGLSFHIFQSLSYVIEVYRGRFLPERNYLVYALYVMFFPQLVAGPIERPQHLLPQFHKPHAFDALRARRGLERMLWGFFKKLVIADNIGAIVASLYSTTSSDGPMLLLAAVLFTFQIYNDFSGYSDIAVGTALVLGYDIMENFERPLSSRSIPEFWRRWHISLSSWLRDYLYYPLALTGRISRARLYASLFVTFVLIGLWHGANWTFVIFGALHGIFVTVSSMSEQLRKVILAQLPSAPRFRHFLQVVTTFSLFTFSLIFFRAQDVQHAFGYVTHIATSWHSIEPLHRWFSSLVTPDKLRIAVFLFAIAVVEGLQHIQTRAKTLYVFDSRSRVPRYAWYYSLILMILLFGYFKAQPFIYFQF
jgi:alginate O-acetyltransferase complex protein AlgI